MQIKSQRLGTRKKGDERSIFTFKGRNELLLSSMQSRVSIASIEIKEVVLYCTRVHNSSSQQ